MSTPSWHSAQSKKRPIRLPVDTQLAQISNTLRARTNALNRTGARADELAAVLKTVLSTATPYVLDVELEVFDANTHVRVFIIPESTIELVKKAVAPWDSPE